MEPVVKPVPELAGQAVHVAEEAAVVEYVFAAQAVHAAEPVVVLYVPEVVVVVVVVVVAAEVAAGVVAVDVAVLTNKIGAVS